MNSIDELIRSFKIKTAEILTEIRYGVFEDYNKYSKKCLKKIISNDLNRKISFEKSLKNIKLNMVEVLTAEVDEIKFTGSGLRITSDGYIMTAYHVIERAIINKKYKNYVKTQSGKLYEIDYKKYYNPLSDLGIIKANFPKEFSGPVPIEAKINYSPKLLKDENIYAIGFLDGKLHLSKGKIINTEVNRTIIDKTLMSNLFETDAQGNKGQSGGVIMNSEAEIIGIIVYKNNIKNSDPHQTGNIGASKIETVKKFIEKIIE